MDSVPEDPIREGTIVLRAGPASVGFGMEHPDQETPQSDHDVYWKDAFDLFLPELVAFFAPDLGDAIDWARGFRSKPTELLPGRAESETGKLVPDRVYEVRLRDGEAATLFLHCEFQSRPEREFARRMFHYHLRLVLEFGENVFSLALLADRNSKFRPTDYDNRRLGSGLRFDFRALKLLDHRHQRNELIESGNVGAILAAIKLIDLLEHDPDVRFREKARVLRRLAREVHDRQLSSQLTRFLIHGIMLPPRLVEPFHRELLAIHKEQTMPFVTIYELEAERRGEARGEALGEARGAEMGEALGRRASLATILKARFGEISGGLKSRIDSVQSIVRLDALIAHAATTNSLSDFDRFLDEPKP